MKIYAVPDDIPVPEPDYKNYDPAKEEAAEAEHRARIKGWLHGLGYRGPLTGELLREGVADGCAEYMYADGPKACLIHLPYGDGYHSQNVQHLPKTEVVRRIKAQKKLDALFSAKKGQPA
jgi:hypothetical protein